jgi:large subunit ribosomal protein L9
MDVILLQDVENLGNRGEIIKVRRGYARNFLIPQGMAAVATESHQRLLAEKVRQEGLQDKKRKRVAEEFAEQHKDLSCTLTVQAGEDDKLFGSVTGRDIAMALAEKDFDLDHKQVLLDEPIKMLGVYSVPVKLHAEVELTVKVWVVKS